METKLSSQGAKFISDTPLYEGDLINNQGSYWPRPIKDDPYWTMLQKNAEGFTFDGSRFAAPHKKAMMYCAMSGGWLGYEKAERYPHKILEHSQRIKDPNDSEFMTIQRLQEALDSSIMGPDIFARNGRLNQAAVEYASRHMPDYHISGPDDREGTLRALHSIHPILRSASYQDAVFEQGVWGPECLLEYRRGIYFADHAWSRNAALEKGVALAVQYGNKFTLDARDGMGYDIVDIQGRPVSITDQAWEDARHIVDVVERGFRTELAVALLASRFMHDDLWASGAKTLDRRHADKGVKAHYANPAQQERMKLLKDTMRPYLAERCNWPTLHRVLREDPALENYWNNEVLPSRPNFKSIPAVEKLILPYVPRGGFEHPALKIKAEQRADPKTLVSFPLAAKPARTLGIHDNPFDAKSDPKIFNDRNWARLGATSKPDQTPANDHLTFEQIAALLVVNATRKARRPANAPRVALYLDDPKGGKAGAEFIKEHGIANPGKLAGSFDPLARSGANFHDTLVLENGQFLGGRLKAYASSYALSNWRDDYQMGNVIGLSDFAAAGSKYKHNGLRQGIQAEGPAEMTVAGIETAVRRFIDIEANAIILPAGEITQRQSRYLVEGALAALGQAPRHDNGTEFQMEFFIDDLQNDEDGNPAEPRKAGLAEIIIRMGTQLKSKMEQPNFDPRQHRDLIVSTARMIDIYEKLIDPERCNVKTTRDPKSGEDKQSKIIDWNQVDPDFYLPLITYAPAAPELIETAIHKVGENTDLKAFTDDAGFKAFMKAENLKTDSERAIPQDPAEQAKAVQNIWFLMRAMPITPDAPVPGLIALKGMSAFDEYDLRDLPDSYGKAKSWNANLGARERTRIFKAFDIHVTGPDIGEP